MKIESVRVVSRSRRIGRTTVRRRGKKMVYYIQLKWTVEPMQELESYHGLDVDEEIQAELVAAILASRSTSE